jgi:hypothetical protein
MIRKLKSGEYRLYSRKVDPKTRKRRNLGTFDTRAAAEKHEREVQHFKRHSSASRRHDVTRVWRRISRRAISAFRTRDAY